MKELYLANMWPQIVTKRGSQLFEEKGYEVSGNWLNRKANYLNADNIILPYANFGEPVLITEATPALWKKVISYILFPDSMVGWNYSENYYNAQKNIDAEIILSKSLKQLSHSNFSAELVDHTYEKTSITVPLGIDIDSINDSKSEKHSELKVLWNHMWRSDKGTYEAFDLISNLAPKYPKVEFWIGQTNSWAEYSGSDKYKEKCIPKLQNLQNMDNVRFFNRVKDQKEYWGWISQADISFSTAFQEGFGLSMMEQEAAGIACVVPNAEAYSELHAGCLIVDRPKLSEGLQTLIESPVQRELVSQSCVNNASNYDISVWVKAITEQLAS